MKTEVMRVYGMVCYACTDIVKAAVERAPGVAEAQVNYIMDTVTLTCEEETDLSAVCLAAKRAGYRLETLLKDKKEDKRIRQTQKAVLRNTVLLSFFCSLLLNGLREILPDAVKLILATVVQLIVIKQFYRDAGWAVINRRGNMSLLIALGTTMGYLYSVAAVLTGAEGGLKPCFDNVAAVVTMVLIGRFIELGTRTQSAEGIRRILNARTETARIQTEEGEEEIPLSGLRPGMRIVVRSGEKAPADGILESGKLCVDESVITGEYFPVEKKSGDRITGASRVINGSAVYKADRELTENFYYRIMEDASRAMLGRKMSVIYYVDRIMEYFVPLVIAIGIITLFLWYGFLSPGNLQKAVLCSLSVFLVACPCAMGLAVPLSVINTISCAAGHGIFIREEGKLEKLGEMKTVFFDKTGTLTTGNVSIESFWCNREQEKQEIMALLYAAEKNAAHPVAKAVCRYALKYEPKQTELYEVEELWGGIRAGTQRGPLYIGTEKCVEAGIGRALSCKKEEEEAIYFAVGEMEGYFTFTDTLREDAETAVKRLKELEVEPVILSGDNKRNVERVAARLSVLSAGCLKPDEKASYLEERRGEKGAVMVGEGINDIPGMLKADVGISMGCGCDTLQGLSDIVIGADRLTHIPGLIALSRAMRKNIYQNMVWAFLYNAIGIIMAVSGILNPFFAGMAMSLSSVMVMLNADRMKKIGNKIMENS